MLPLTVSTDSTIAVAQFIIEYDSTIIRLDSIKLGDDVLDFSLAINLNLPFSATIDNGKNALTQIFVANPAQGFSGEKKEVITFYCYSIGVDQQQTPLIFDQAPNHTFLSTQNLYDIKGEEIVFMDGQLVVPVESASKKIDVVPQKYRLCQNYPNPFNAETTIRYELPEASHVLLKVLDVRGREILRLADEQCKAGYYLAMWDSRDKNGFDVSSGIYFIQFVTKEYATIKKMLLVR